VFILDTKKEHIGVTEANKLGLPIIAVVDTNCDPDIIQFVIPGNDDAIRSGSLMCRVIADAVEEGRYIASRRGNAVAAPAPERTEDDEARVAAQQAEARRQALLAQQDRDARLAGGGPPIPPPPVAEVAEPAPADVAEAAPEPAEVAEPVAEPAPADVAESAPEPAAEAEPAPVADDVAPEPDTPAEG
jgi:small subunit ribosomal protein S2